MKEALLYEKLENEKVRCQLCNHFCTVSNGKYGLCGVRKNDGGVLYSLSYGNIIAEHCDPVEKKPLYHFLPGSRTFSIAAPGCNFRCRFCQNWHISQVRERYVSLNKEKNYHPEQIIRNATENACKSIAYTYTEPTVFYEVIKETESMIADQGTLYSVVVSNGFMSGACIEEMNRFIHAYNIDIKSFSEQFYRNYCGASLQPVLENVKKIHSDKIWLELTTMLIPGENDSTEEIEKITSFISKIDTNIPWHISRFFPDYKLQKHRITSDDVLNRAKEIGAKNGLKHIYMGNTIQKNYTECPECGEHLVERSGYKIKVEETFKKGICTKCGEKIAGLWE